MKKTSNNKILSSYSVPNDIEDMMIEHHPLIDEFSKEIFPKMNSKGFPLYSWEVRISEVLRRLNKHGPDFSITWNRE
jgi:hypothetical protein